MESVNENANGSSVETEITEEDLKHSQNDIETVVADEGDGSVSVGSASSTPRKKKRRNRKRKGKGDKPQSLVGQRQAEELKTLLEAEEELEPDTSIHIQEHEVKNSSEVINAQQKPGESIHVLLERAKQNAITGMYYSKPRPSEISKPHPLFFEIKNPNPSAIIPGQPNFMSNSNDASTNLSNQVDALTHIPESKIVQGEISSSSGSHEINDGVTSTEIETDLNLVDESELSNEYSAPKFQMNDKMVDQEELEQQVLETLGDETSSIKAETETLSLLRIPSPLLEKDLENPISGQPNIFYSKQDENENQEHLDFDQIIPEEIMLVHTENNGEDIQENGLRADEITFTDQRSVESPYEETPIEKPCSPSHTLLMDINNILEHSNDASTITDPVVISLICPNIYTVDESLLLDPAALSCNWTESDFENYLNREVATMTDPVTISLPYDSVKIESASEENAFKNKDDAKKIVDKLYDKELSGWKNEFDANDSEKAHDINESRLKEAQVQEVVESNSALLIDLKSDSLDLNVATSQFEEFSIIEKPRTVESFSVDCLTHLQSQLDPNGNDGVKIASSQKTDECVESILETVATPAIGSLSNEGLLRLDREWNQNETRGSYGNVRPTEAIISPSRSSSTCGSSRRSQQQPNIAPSVLVEEEKESSKELTVASPTKNDLLKSDSTASQVAELEILKQILKGSSISMQPEKDHARGNCVEIKEASQNHLVGTHKPFFGESPKRRVGPLKAEHIPIEIPVEQSPTELVQEAPEEEYVASSSDDEKGQVCCGFMRSRSKTNKKGQKKESGRSERSPSLKDRITNAARKHFSKQ